MSVSTNSIAVPASLRSLREIFLGRIFVELKIIANFANVTRRRSLEEGRRGGCRHVIQSVYQALVLGFLKCGSFKITDEDEATIGAFRVWYNYA